MKFLIAVALLVLLYLGARSLLDEWKSVQSTTERGTQPAMEVAPTAPAGVEPLPGLPPLLEASLEAAKRQGAAALRTWLRQNRAQIQDPRLADIELDFVLLVAGRNFGEAREVFAQVQRRVPPESPVYPRIRKLEKTYQ
jgi:hypothetical protein